MDTYRYKEAIALANKNVKKKKLNIQDRLFWLNLEANALLKRSNFKKLLSVSNDLATLSDAYNQKEYKKSALYYQFFALFGLKQYNKALLIAQTIEKNYKNEFKNIEVFQKIVNYAKMIDNNTLLINYAKKIISIQKIYKSFVLSPQIELALIKSLKSIAKFKEAKDVAKELLQRVQASQTRARVLYELGDISLNLKEKTEAKKYFKECSKIKKTSWSSLCKESLSIY